MSQKTYLWILKTGIYASFIIFLFVFKNLLFPYITSKQIPFNILIEVLTVFWLAFIIKYPKWSPFKTKNKIKNCITYGLIAFFGVLTISCFTGVDFNLSFWGDVERMLGVFHLLHFLVFYFIIITVMRDWKDWKMLFTVSLIAGFFVAIKGLTGGNNHSTIGNTAYVSGLMIFSIYFAIILFFKETKYKNWRWLYLLTLPTIFMEFKSAGTSGALVGLAFSVVCFSFLYGLFYAIKKDKEKQDWKKAIIFLGLFIIIAGSTIFIFTNRDNKFVSKIEPVKEININKNTFQTRLISWNAAIKDFRGHWLLGVGHGNYAIIFDRHFKASFYDYSRGETYFDRAHNNILDIMSTSGILGLVTHLFIFIAIGVYLFRALSKKRIGILEFCLISSLLIAYFVQNLAVFDSFVTYVSFMVILGYIHFVANTEEESGGTKNLLLEGDRDIDNNETSSLVVAGVILLVIMYQFNILPIKMLIKTIDGQILFGQNKLLEAIAVYDEALGYETVLDRDSRDTLVRSLISRSNQIAALDQQKAKEIINFGIDQMQRNITLAPGDSLMNMQLARMYDVGFRVIQDKDKKQEYADKSMEAINASLTASPERIPVYFLKSQFLVNQGKIEEAIKILEYSGTLNEKYFENSCQLGQVYLIAGKDDQGFEYIDKCMDNGGVGFIGYKGAVEKSINHYAEEGDISRLLMLYEHLLKFDRNNPKIWINIARLYAKTGNIEKSEAAARQAAKINPELKADVESFIKSLKNQ